MDAGDHFGKAVKLHKQGKDYLPALKDAARATLRSYIAEEVSHVEILDAAGSSCPKCRAQNGKVLPVRDAWTSMPIPVEDCERGFCRCTYVPCVE